MLVLLSGRLRVVGADGDELSQVAPGQSFGEMGALTGHRRFAGIEAIEASTALCLHRRALRSLTGERTRIYVKILETAVDILAHRLTDTEHSRP